MVEAAFAIPLMLLCTVAVIYFGRAYYLSQLLAFGAQEGARIASGIPRLGVDQSALNAIRGFTKDGQQADSASPIYQLFSSAKLLSEGTSGNLPPGARVKVLPWDADGPDDVVPDGTVAVAIEYPYSLIVNPFTGDSGDIKEVWLSGGAGSKVIPFPDFKIRERATAAQLVYQEAN